MAASFYADVYRASLSGLAVISRRNIDIDEKLNRDLRQSYRVQDDACGGGQLSVARQRHDLGDCWADTMGCRRRSFIVIDSNDGLRLTN